MLLPGKEVENESESTEDSGEGGCKATPTLVVTTINTEEDSSDIRS